MKSSKSSKVVLVAFLVGASMAMTACGKKEETPVEKAADKVGDALNMRENEKLKDAGEDAKSAVENAAEAVKEEADKVTSDK